MLKQGVIVPLKSGYSRAPGWGVSVPATQYDRLGLADAGLAPAISAPQLIALLGIAATSGNQGVQALGESLVSLCMRFAAGGGVRMFIGHSQPVLMCYRVAGESRFVPAINYRLSPRSALREHLAWIVVASVMYRLLPFPMPRRLICRATPWIRALEQSAIAADIRGGDSFSDIYGMQRFVTGFLVAWTVLLVKGTIIQLPQTYGPFKSPLARWMARFLLRRSSVIVARDHASMRVAQDLAGPSREVLLSPDVAFSLDATRPETLVLDPPLAGLLPTGIIGVNVNGLMYHGGYTRDNMFGLKMDYPGFLRNLLLALLKEQTHEIWLMPHTYAPDGDVESDPDASRQLRNSLPSDLRERVRIIAAEYGPLEIKGVIGMCDFFIGSRMHSCIAALSQAIPCVGVAYSMKFKGVFETVGMEAWVIDGRDVGADEAVRRTIDLYRSRESIREPLRQRAASARQRLAEVFEEIMEKLGLRAGMRTAEEVPKAPGAESKLIEKPGYAG